MKNKIYWNILDKQRAKILKILSKNFTERWYLAGGTALALQIAHRESYDFDLFRNNDLTFAVKRKALKTFESFNPKVLVDTSDELSFVLDAAVKVTLLNYYWDPLFPLVKNEGLIPLLSIKDIATTKAYALGRRGNYRDYFDLYVIIKNKLASLRNIIKWCKKKYADVFSERMFIEQLTYLGDVGKDEKLKFLGEKYLFPKKMETFFAAEIKKLKII